MRVDQHLNIFIDFIEFIANIQGKSRYFSISFSLRLFLEDDAVVLANIFIFSFFYADILISACNVREKCSAFNSFQYFSLVTFMSNVIRRLSL